MMHFEVGLCQLKTKKEMLESFLQDNYMRFYKKEKLKHVTRNDKRLPKIKVTDDIFSVQIWFKDKSKAEHKIFVDGSVSLNDITIHTITINKYSFNEYEYASFLEVLKKLTSISDGYMLASTDDKAQKIANGEIYQYKQLLDEVFSKIDLENNEEIATLYDWMLKVDKKDQ